MKCVDDLTYANFSMKVVQLLLTTVAVGSPSGWKGRLCRALPDF